jgi:hypothetical protein
MTPSSRFACLPPSTGFAVTVQQSGFPTTLVSKNQIFKFR